MYVALVSTRKSKFEGIISSDVYKILYHHMSIYIKMVINRVILCNTSIIISENENFGKIKTGVIICKYNLFMERKKLIR